MNWWMNGQIKYMNFREYPAVNKKKKIQSI